MNQTIVMPIGIIEESAPNGATFRLTPQGLKIVPAVLPPLLTSAEISTSYRPVYLVSSVIWG